MPYEDEDPQAGRIVEPPTELDERARSVIGAAIEVHKELGPGLPELAYQRSMEVELQRRNIPFEAQKSFRVIYKGVLVAEGKMDLLVAGKLVVEIKAVEQIVPVHRLQVLTYMRNVQQPLGLLLNFNVSTLRQGIRRIIQSF